MHLSLPKRFPLFILASVCWSLLCLISALTQEVWLWSLFFQARLVLWRGRDTGSNCHWRVLTRGSPPLTARVLSRLHCSDSGLLCRELSDASPCLHALLRSGPLRFRVSGTPQRRRLGWACVLRPAQARAAQVTRCLAGEFARSWRLWLTRSPIPAARFSGCTMGAPS